MRSLSKPVPSGSPTGSTARTGRGGLALAAAKLYFLLLGLAQQIALTWLLKESYGGLRGALSPTSITYNPLVSSGVQGMSHAVSRSTEEESDVWSAFSAHALLAVLAGAGFWLFAPVLGRLLESSYLVASFRILALVVLLNGLYAPLVGMLNGRRKFVWQAALDGLAATLRTVGLLAGAWYCAGLGTERAVAGTSVGFAGATALSALAAWLLVRRSAAGGPGAKTSAGFGFALRRQFAFVLPVLAGQVLLNLLLQADTNTLRAFATRAALAAGQSATAADPLVGAYSAAQLFAFLPYQLLIALTFVLFPMLAQAHALGRHDDVAHLVRQGTRLSAIIIGLIVSVSAGLPRQLLGLVFPEPLALLGAPCMPMLCLGLGAFALFGVFTTVLNSLGRQWLGLAAVALALVLVVATNAAWVYGSAFGGELLERTAMSTSAAVLLATVAAATSLRLVAGPCLPGKTLLRVPVALGVCILGASFLPALSPLLTVFASGAIAAAYTLTLVASGELSQADLELVRGLRR